jgi:hypothetical protein
VQYFRFVRRTNSVAMKSEQHRRTRNVGVVIVACAIFSLPCLATASDPQAASARFASSVAAIVLKTYANETAAAAAGYANDSASMRSGWQRYVSTRLGAPHLETPNAIIYDNFGKPIRAEYWVYSHASATPPHIWGIEASRWFWVGAHIDWSDSAPDANNVFGRYWSDANRYGPGSDLYPTERDFQELNKLSQSGVARTVVAFPAAWHLSIDVRAKTVDDRNVATMDQ